MTEKLERSKEFIEEVEQLKRSYIWLYGAMDDVYVNPSRKFPALKDFLFGDTGSSKIHAENQLTFAKIWAGEIELVEKKPKYVIWAKGSKVDDRAEYMYENAIRGHITTVSLRTSGAVDDKYCHFDQDFAFAMYDTGKFKIEKVVD